MKEHPIIFSTDMVKAILDGRKTMTRRVIVPQPAVKNLIDFSIRVHRYRNTLTWHHPKYGFHNVDNSMLEHCPYGQVGDRLWVRETWWTPPHNKIDKNPNIVSYKEIIYSASGRESADKHSWYPSIHMPRWALRITLEITEVRVERLQEITEEDATAEGIELLKPSMCCYTNRYCFQILWNSLNAKRGYSWESNPFVWCISFK